MSTEEAREKLAQIESQIAELKSQRDSLLASSGMARADVLEILRRRTPKRTLCQLLRELHDVLTGTDREKVEQCLLIAKKMDLALVRHYGSMYAVNWYDERGVFRG